MPTMLGDNMPSLTPAQFLRSWFIAARPWSFTASAIPVLLGTSLALYHGYSNWPLFFLVLLAGIFLQAGTNFFNTYGDFIAGVDTKESALTCPQLVQEINSPKAMYRAGILSFLIVAVISVILIYNAGWILLAYAFVGLAGGYYYTNGKYPYKYHALGPFFVFLLMGPLMVCPTYYIVTGTNSFAAFFLSLSIGFLVAGIMHGNDIRDIEHDQQAGIKTLAMRLGAKKALQVFVGLYALAYLSIFCGVAFKILPVLALLPIVLLPSIVKSLKPLLNNDKKVDFLEGWGAKHHLLFGVLLTLGILLSSLLKMFWS